MSELVNDKTGALVPSALDRPPWWPREHSEACIEGMTYDGAYCHCADYMDWVKRLRAHPAYPALFERYKQARQAWRCIQPPLIVPMAMREYCNAIVNQGGPIIWSDDRTNGIGVGIVIDRAWEDSGLAG